MDVKILTDLKKKTIASFQAFPPKSHPLCLNITSPLPPHCMPAMQAKWFGEFNKAMNVSMENLFVQLRNEGVIPLVDLLIGIRFSTYSL